MPQVTLTLRAMQGMERCRLFLFEKNPSASKIASQKILTHFQLLKTDPEIGRLVEDVSGMRELIIPFGGSGYIALYDFDPNQDLIIILAFRHQKKLHY